MDQALYHVERAAYDHPDQYSNNRHASEPWVLALDWVMMVMKRVRALYP
jgi:hypothetical protein